MEIDKNLIKTGYYFVAILLCFVATTVILEPFWQEIRAYARTHRDYAFPYRIKCILHSLLCAVFIPVLQDKCVNWIRKVYNEVFKKVTPKGYKDEKTGKVLLRMVYVFAILTIGQVIADLVIQPYWRRSSESEKFFYEFWLYVPLCAIFIAATQEKIVNLTNSKQKKLSEKKTKSKEDLSD